MKEQTTGPSGSPSLEHPLGGAAERFVKARDRVLLLIEDTAAHAALICRALEPEGWKIEHVTRSSAALQSFAANSNRIVLLDLTLPDDDGLAVLKRLLTLSPEAHIIIVTALEQVSTSVEAMRIGAVDYVVKGDPQETTQRLRESVRRAYEKRLEAAERSLISEAKVFELVRAERLEAIELIVRTVCHEVNNPLSGVVALSQLLGERAKGVDEDLKKLADGILNSAQQVAQVVKKLNASQDKPKEFGGKGIIDLV